MNDEQWKTLRSKARASANQDYESTASGIQSLSRREVDDVLKTAAVDQSTLDKLMAIVLDAEKSNIEKADAIRNTEGLVKLTVSLLGKLLK